MRMHIFFGKYNLTLLFLIALENDKCESADEPFILFIL